MGTTPQKNASPRMQAFGHRMKEIRSNLGYTQEEFAEKLNCSRVAYAYYESGRRTPDVEFLNALKELTNMPLDYILGYTDNPTPDTIGLDKSLGLSTKAVNRLKGFSQLQKTINRLLENERVYDVADFLSQFNYFDACRLLLASTTLGEDANIEQSRATESLFTIASSIVREIFKAKNYEDIYWGEMPTVHELEESIASEEKTRSKARRGDGDFLTREKALLEALQRKAAEANGKETR